MKKNFIPFDCNTLMLTNGVYSLFRSDEGTKPLFAIEYFPTRECVDTFEIESEAREFFHEACQSEREGKPVECADDRTVSFTLAGMLAIAGIGTLINRRTY